MTTAIKERALPCQADSVLGILEGIKSQTRRPIKPRGKGYISDYINETDPNDKDYVYSRFEDESGQHIKTIDLCPYGKPGDRLWVRERARLIEADGQAMNVRAVTGIKKGQKVRLRYEADGIESGWLPYPTRLSYLEIGDCVSNGCYKEARRILLEILSIRVERVQDISEADAKAEGAKIGQCYKQSYGIPTTYRAAYQDWYKTIYGSDAWERNDWVWVIEFKNITDNKGV